MESFKTINKDVTGEIVEKKSRFIAHVFYVETIEDAEEKIKKIKKEYHDAKHNVFAYAIETGDGGIAIKYNDDGEPSGTAGSPILKMVLEQGLSNILVVVTRYFGGILLGTGGLVRAYSDATKVALEKAEIVSKILGNKIDVFLEYEEFEKFKYYAGKNNLKIVNVQYLDKVMVNVEIDNEKLEELTNSNNIKEFTIIEIKNIIKKFIEI